MTQNLTLREKDKIVKKIYRNYQRAQLDILFFNQHYNYYPQIDLFKVGEKPASYNQGDQAFINQLQKKQELESFCEIIHQIQKYLSRDAYFFIEHEYLNFYDPNWWVSYFSRATYYRLKHQALNEFLEYALSYWSLKDMREMVK